MLAQGASYAGSVTSPQQSKHLLSMLLPHGAPSLIVSAKSLSRQLMQFAAFYRRNMLRLCEWLLIFELAAQCAAVYSQALCGAGLVKSFRVQNLQDDLTFALTQLRPRLIPTLS